MNRIAFALVLSLLFIGCGEKKEVDFVARVGNHFLTESMISEAITGRSSDKLFREEFIREWIEKEVIYLAAVKSGVLESKKYSYLIKNAEVEIANSILISEAIESSKKKISKEELEKYYVENIAKFKLTSEQMLYNQVSFNKKSDAKKFRRRLVSSSWEEALEEFLNNKSLVFSEENILEYKYNIFPITVRERLRKLRKSNNSAVFESSDGIFTVLRLNKFYKKNEVPEFFEIEHEIEKKYLMLKRKEFYNNYIKQLYSKYSSEIER
jgi:hypothetical protein